MTDDQWPPEVTDFYESLSLGDGPRASISQTCEAVLETRRWKRIAGTLAAACIALAALVGFALLGGEAVPRIADSVGEPRAVEEGSGGTNEPPIADEPPAIQYDVMAVYIHRDWCGKCKKMGNLFAELQQDLSGRRVMFLRLDLTDSITTRQSQLLGDRLKINDALNGIESGKIVLLDRHGQMLETLDGLSGREYLAHQIAMRVVQ